MARPAWPALPFPRDFFPDLASARRIGRRYLASLPSSLDKNAILGASPALAKAIEASPQVRAALLRRSVAEDFRRGDVAIVDGWVLSASEARLCALAALD